LLGILQSKLLGKEVINMNFQKAKVINKEKAKIKAKKDKSVLEDCACGQPE